MNIDLCAQEATAYCNTLGNVFPLLLLSRQCHGRGLALQNQLQCQKIEAHLLFIKALATKSQVCLHFLGAGGAGAFSELAGDASSTGLWPVRIFCGALWCFEEKLPGFSFASAGEDIGLLGTSTATKPEQLPL